MQKPLIAIHPDKTPLSSGRSQSFSSRWLEIAESLNCSIKLVDVYAGDFFSSLSGCDGFMWHFWNAPRSSDPGKRVMQAIAHATGLPTYPSWKTCWFFEDKHAQRYLLEYAGIPMPASWLFWSKESALAFLQNATFPLVAKLAYGITSSNVRLVSNSDDARYLVERIFGDGVVTMQSRTPSLLRRKLYRVENASRALLGKPLLGQAGQGPVQKGCILFQEFLQDNTFDIRVTVIGRRAFAFRRNNRPDDFRASGSGSISWAPEHIDPEAVKLGFRSAIALQSQVLTLDILKRGNELVVVEISHYYEAWAVAKCPGHWLRNETGGAGLVWVPGNIEPADAIFVDFIEEVSGQSSNIEK